MCQEEIGSVCLVSPSSLPLTLHLSAPYMALFLIHSPAQQKGYKKKEKQAPLRPHSYSLAAASLQVWPGVALVKAGGWEMVTCPTSLVSLLAFCRFWRWWCKDTWMQNQLKSIKPELLASALRGGREVEAEPWTIMQNISRSGVPEILQLPCGAAPARGGSLGSATVNLSCNNQVRRSEGFLQDQPGPKLSLCQVAQVSMHHHTSGVLQYRESQPWISRPDGELPINQCLFSMICL